VLVSASLFCAGNEPCGQLPAGMQNCTFGDFPSSNGVSYEMWEA